MLLQPFIVQRFEGEDKGSGVERNEVVDGASRIALHGIESSALSSERPLSDGSGAVSDITLSCGASTILLTGDFEKRSGQCQGDELALRRVFKALTLPGTQRL